MIFLVTNINEAEGIGRQAPRIIEFAIGGALRAKSAQEASLRIQDLNAMIITTANQSKRTSYSNNEFNIQ